MKPFFSYSGSKYRLAGAYPLPEHSRIIEPFAGSAGYSLRHADHEVILVDRDPVIAGLWKWLINVSEDEVLSLPDVKGPVAALDVCQEARWLIGFWCSRGVVSPRAGPSTWMLKHAADKPLCFWGEAARARIASQLAGIRHWQAYHSSWDRVPDVRATWFVDPPYVGRGRRYVHSRVDYCELGRWCRSRRGQVIACEGEGADWLPFTTLRSASKTLGRGRTHTERVWLGLAETPVLAPKAPKEGRQG